ncbi:MAG: hypothetical protein KJ044_15275, partial [Planctomycetes bacterium]|nr:hypothetical protein [Planctomycetota bacterium]
SDYAVFTGDPGTLGANYKCVGNLYGAGNMYIPYTGAQLLGDVVLTGTISHTNGQPWSYTFPLSNPLQNQPAIPFPTWAAPWTSLETVAQGFGHYWAENTLEIIFDGTNYHRRFVRRKVNGTGGGTVPTGTGWLDISNGTTSYIHASLNNTDYECVVETLAIPDEGVIYVKSGMASAISATKDSLGGGCTNNFTQTRFATNGSAWSLSNTDIVDDNYNHTTTPILLLSGRLDNRRVSLACDHKIVVKQPIVYQTLLTNPGYRRFWADGVNGKESAGALGFKEMLGVMSKGDIHPAVTWWSNLSTLYGGSPGVTDVVGEYLPGHYPADTTSMDGVYLALGHTAPVRHYGYVSGTGPRGEHWLHGGLIARGSYGGGLGNSYYRRNYDWDYRMRLTCPPYFLRAYNTSAVYIPGTWRTFEM